MFLQAMGACRTLLKEVERQKKILDRLSVLVDIVAADCKSGSDRPRLTESGGLWRYQVDRSGLQWSENSDPIKAAEDARSWLE